MKSKNTITLKNTTPGHHTIPSWVLRNCSFELAELIAHTYNCSIHSGVVPNPWLIATVTPVPMYLCSLSDYRPISVTPILFRIVEKYIVKRFLRSAIPLHAISYQFAFKPTGSITCALVCLQHHISLL